MTLRTLVAFAVLLLAVGNTSLSAADHPNIVIIYGDDVGYGDVGAYGSTLIPTPNIDRLASEGLQFTDGHCSAATCTPSRFSMLTGIFGFRHNVRVLPPDAPLTIKPEMLTLPQVLKQAGYHTAVIGKWHLGIGDGQTPVDWNGDVQPGPLEVGFDYSFLLPSTNDRVPCVYVENHRVVNLDKSDPLFVGKKPEGVTATEYPDGKTNREAMTYYQSSHGHDFSIINGIGRIGYQWGGKSALWDDETMADVFVEQAKEYLAARNKDEPFFLYFSSQDIHVPRAPHPRFHGVSKLSYRGDAMVQLDWSTGEILDALEEAGLSENTIVIFTSDNGPVYDDGYEDGTTVRTSTAEVDRGHDGSGIYRGGKYQIYEGGTRVPFIVRWPARIQPGKSAALVNQIDFLASFAALVDAELPADQAGDSRNILPALLGEDSTGLPYMVEEAGRRVALRQGPWKFITRQGNNPLELYNLESDPGEQHNVADEHEEIVAELRAKLQAIRQGEGVRRMDIAAQRSEQDQAIAAVEQVHGRVMYDYHLSADGRWQINAQPPQPGDARDFRPAIFLDLDSPAVTNEVMPFLKGLPGLQFLHFSNTNLSVEGFAELRQLSKLKFLTLNCSGVDDEVLAHVGTLDKLEELWISNAEITDVGLTHLQGLPALRRLSIMDCNVSAEAIARLQTALPECEIDAD